MRGLRFYLVLQIVLPLAALTTLLVTTAFSTLESLVETRLEKEIELVARALRIPVQEALAEGALERMRQSLSGVFEIGGVYGVYVFDAEGRRVLTAGEMMPGRREQVQAAELVAVGEQLGQYEDLGGEAVYSFFVPLTGPGGQIDGLLQVVRQQSEIALRLAEFRQRGLLLLAGAVLLMIGIVIIGHRLAVGRHVDSLLVAMQRIERGDSQHRARVSGPRELSALASGLNRMMDSIHRMQTELTEQQQAQVAMSRQLRDQEKYAALGRFSSGVAHELGAPLTVIDGDARRLADNTRLAEDDQRRLRRLRAQVDRTRRLIRQLMDFVRADRRPAEAVPLRDVVQHAVSGVQPEAEARRVRLETRLPDARLRVSGHAIRLEHAVLNLLRNAVQATPGGQVRLSAALEDEVICLRIEDDGPGVPPDEVEHIFEPFHTTREEGEGTGLGLAIVRTVADEHGGRVRVTRSAALGGSCFELLLPAGETA